MNVQNNIFKINKNLFKKIILLFLFSYLFKIDATTSAQEQLQNTFQTMQQNPILNENSQCK